MDPRKREQLPDPVTVEIETGDGIAIRCRRYPRAGARAVLCAHGLASTGYKFDLPVEGYRISEVLYRLGYEVWILNFRGAGHPPWLSDAGDWSHSGDQLAAFDLPPVIDRIRDETGLPPFYFGHSFGGMALYMYLAGVEIEGDPPRKVRLDAELARLRNESIAGALTAASPVAIPKAHLDIVERLRHTQLVQRPYWRLERYLLRRHSTGKQRIVVAETAMRLSRKHPLLTRIVISLPLIRGYMRPANMSADARYAFATWAAGDVSALQVAQIVNMTREGTLSSMQVPQDGRVTYSDGLSSITVPLAVAEGTRDFPQPLFVRHVLDSVSSTRKRLVSVVGKGHCDMLFHLPLEEVFRWLEVGQL